MVTFPRQSAVSPPAAAVMTRLRRLKTVNIPARTTLNSSFPDHSHSQLQSGDNSLITEAFYCHHLQSVVEQLQSRHWHHILNSSCRDATGDWCLVPNKQHHLQIRSLLTTPSCPPPCSPGPAVSIRKPSPRLTARV